MPENDSSAPRSSAASASAGPPVKQWNTVRSGIAFGVEHGEGVVPRLACVDHQRQVELVGERDLLGERRRAAPSRGEWS